MMVDLLHQKPDDILVSPKDVADIDTPIAIENPRSSSDKRDPPIIFVLGGPGSGKGTQCGCIVRGCGFTHFSPGDLLREEVKSGSEKGQEMKKRMDAGELVPSEWTIGLLKNAMEKTPNPKGYLIDGFPRDKEGQLMFEKLVRPCDLMLMFECSEDIMMKRILQRATTSGRGDDNKETLKKRFATFEAKTLPVISHYESRGKVARVNSERSVEEVCEDIFQILKKNKLLL